MTGAGGEIGHGLIGRLAAAGRSIVTIDIAPLEQRNGILFASDSQYSIRNALVTDVRRSSVRNVAATYDYDRPHAELTNYNELAMRIIGAYIDTQKAHDVFLFEQDGSFVLRLFGTAGTRGTGHQLSEFTRDEILAMIESAPEQRQQPAPNPTGAQ